MFIDNEKIIKKEEVKKFELQKIHKWVCNIDGLDSFLFQKFKIPKLEKSLFGSFSLNLSICSDTTYFITNWYTKQEKKDAIIKFYDSSGVVIETTNINGILLLSVDFNELDYNSLDIRKINVDYIADSVIVSKNNG